jgi:DNA-binding SARP family transcriptional activator
MVSDTPRFTLELLGGASIVGPDGPLTGRAAQRHRLGLLAVLAAASRGVKRDKVIALLWPEREPQRARHALSDSIYRVNHALGEEAVVTAGNRDLWLDDGVLSSDLASFCRAVDRECWRRAADEYGGPFLDGFHLSGAPGFEHWMAGERRVLARRYAETLESLAEERAQAGELDAAVEAWRRRATLDRCDARVAVRLMEALAAQGNPAAALQQATIHARLLEHQFGTGPDPDVVAMAERIRKAGATSRGANGSTDDRVRDANAGLDPADSEPEPDLGSSEAGAGLGSHAGSRDAPVPSAAPAASIREEGGNKARTRISIAAGVAIVVLGLAGLRFGGLLPFPTASRFSDLTTAAYAVPGATAVTDTPSVAVLPFQDLTANGD